MPQTEEQAPSTGQRLAQKTAQTIQNAVMKQVLKNAASLLPVVGQATRAALLLKEFAEDPFKSTKNILMIITGIILLLIILIALLVLLLAGGPSTEIPVATTGEPTNCDEKYAADIAKNPLRANFGDPLCDFTKDGLYTLLKQIDPQNADQWFSKVIPCESGYNPNAYASPATGTPNPYGAWGLFQMGNRSQSNNSNDLGDVPWNSQASNAVAYLALLNGNGARYWACW
jgi:hypothetical protein